MNVCSSTLKSLIQVKNKNDTEIYTFQPEIGSKTIQFQSKDFIFIGNGGFEDEDVDTVD